MHGSRNLTSEDCDPVFINFNATHGGSHNNLTRKRVRSEAAKISHRSTTGKAQTPAKLKARIRGDAGSSRSLASGRTSNISLEPDSKRDEYLPDPEGTRHSSDSQSFQSKRHCSDGARCFDLDAEPMSAESYQSDDVLLSDTSHGLVQFPGSIPRSPAKSVELDDQWPVPFQEFYPSMLEYMWSFMMRGWQVMDTEAHERQTALIWVQRLTMMDSSYFYMNMLSIAMDLATRNDRFINDRVVLWLLGETVSSINDALNDAKRRLSVGTILAVGRVALHEITFGDSKAGRLVHRPAQLKMIRLAGGLDALELPDLVKRHILWADRLMAVQTGTSMLPEQASELTATDHLSSFSADIKVLDAYMPSRSREDGRI